MSIFSFFESRLNPYPDDDYVLPTDNFLKFLWACTKGLRGWIFGLMCLTALIGVYESLLFAWIGKIVDWLSMYTPSQLWYQKQDSLIMMMVVLFISPFVVSLSSLIHFQVLQGVFPMQMRWRFHRQMLGQSMQFYQDEFSGRVSAKVMQTALAVRETIMTIADMFVYVIVYFVSSGVILANLDGWLLLPFVGWLVLFVATIGYFIPKFKASASRQANARALMTGRITDAYANIMTVKLFSYSKRELDYAKGALGQFMDTVHDQMRWVSKLEVVNHSINMLLVVSTIGIGLYLWAYQNLSVGAIAAATAMALRLNGLTHWIMWQTAGLFENIGTVQDGMKTLSKPHTIIDKPNAKKLTVTQGDVVFDNVSFGYGKTDDMLLQNFNLTIKSGEKIGLVGQSGAGKSTLVNLLLRFYDVTDGQIRIDNQNIACVSQESLRQHIGMVTQDTSLLHRSVRENIAYGKPDATDDDIWQVLKKAHADEFVKQLNDNNGNSALDVQVGERGVKLSGGQRQRIAIARVMLKNAPILLLDEATSALDSEVEYAITTSLNQMMAGKTVIAIAHRLSTIASMDRLVVMDKGRIVEMGSHDELIAKGGVYARLWARQSGGFLGEI